MALNTVTLTWNLTDCLQSPVGQAQITIAPAVQVTIPSANLVLVTKGHSYTFSGGSGSRAGIVATDNAGMSPASFKYLVSVTNAVDTRQVLVPQFSTPLDFANGAVQDLADLLAAVL